MGEMYVCRTKLLMTYVKQVNPKLAHRRVMCRAALIGCQIGRLMLLIPQRNRFPSDVRRIEEELIAAVLALARQ